MVQLKSTAYYCNEFVGITLLFVRHADTMLRALGYVGPIRVQTSLKFLREVPWLHGSSGLGAIFPKNVESQLDDEVEFSLATTTEDLREKPDEVVMKILYYNFFAVNWPDQIDTQPKLEELLRAGYRYNAW
jgi:hypothetical protein